MKKLLLLAFQLGFLLPSLSGQSIMTYKKSAEEAFAAKDYATAYIHAKEVFRKDTSANLDLLKIAMMASVEVCEFDQAEQYMRTISEIAPDDNDPVLIFYRAKNQHRQGNYEEANQAYSDFIAASGSSNPELVSLAKQKAAECNELLESPLLINNTSISSPRMLQDLSTPGQSDFAMPIFNDNIIVGKLTPPEQCECEKPCSDKISLYQRDNSGTADKLALPKSFKKVGHITYAKAGQRAYFTSCKCKDDSYTCEIFYADRIAGGDGWSSPVKLPSHINHGKDYTSTQPFYLQGRGGGNDTLFYVSDFHAGQEAGRADLDIFYSVVVGDDHKPSVSMKEINTTGDEVTPYFHKTTNTFYFSSNGYMTLGGYDFDIFKYIPPQYDAVECSGNSTVVGYSRNVQNMGSPINTQFDDLFFSKEEESERMIFSSNREGHKYAELEHCCPDVFEAVYSPKVDIIVSVYCHGGDDCTSFEREAIGNEESQLLQWTGEYELPEPTREGNVFTFRNVPLEKTFDMRAELAGYKPGIGTINTGECDGETITLDLFLEPEITLSVNFVDFCDESTPIDVNNFVVTDQGGRTVNPTNKEGYHTYQYDLCPGMTYTFSTASCNPADTLYKFELAPETIDISTECRSEDFAYIFKLYKSEEEIIEEGITLFFDHDQPRPTYDVSRDYQSFFAGYLDGSDYDQTLAFRFNPRGFEQKNLTRVDTTRIKEYIDAGCNRDTNVVAVTNFFNEAEANYNRLVSLSDNILAYYLADYDIKIDIEGAASGSGGSTWNNNLSGRRIATMTQYFRKYFEEEGEAFDENRIAYNRVPKGSSAYEKLKEANRYPRTGECRIYDVRAARDRNINILRITFIPPPDAHCPIGLIGSLDD